MADHAKTMAACLEDDLATPVRDHHVDRALEAAGLDLDIDRARELLRWADMYGEPEEWCKKAQALHAKCEKTEQVLVELATRVLQLEQVLKPFAAVADRLEGVWDDEDAEMQGELKWGDDEELSLGLVDDARNPTVGAYRRAREVLRADQSNGARPPGAQPKAEPDKQSQRLILEFTRLRQAYADAVNRKEEAGTDATYQRGLVAGLQAAIGKVEA